MTKRKRVRFAPSPTGPLHIGGLKTALINYIYAKQVGAEFLLRIEDTDQSRLVDGSESYIERSLDWIGIKGYRKVPNQSTRLKSYKTTALKLLKEGKAYLSFDTPEDLEKIKKVYSDKGSFFKYNFLNREDKTLKNSFTLSKTDIKNNYLSGLVPYVIRLKSDGDGAPVRVKDYLRKEISVDRETLVDIIIFKSDGFPTYHLANVVDDHADKVTTVIRGSEWLSSFPLHILLYDYLGFDKPEFVHIPLIMNPDGKKKLSKRDGDTLGFPVFPLSYGSKEKCLQKKGFKELGIHPKAMLNYLILLGWNEKNGNNKIYTYENLLEKFSLDRIKTSSSNFDFKLLNNINKSWIKKLTDEEIVSIIESSMKRYTSSVDQKISDYRLPDYIVDEIKNKLISLDELEIYKLVRYLYLKPKEYIGKNSVIEASPDYIHLLKKFVKNYSLYISSTNTGDANTFLNDFIKVNSLKTSDLYKLLRLTLVGSISGFSVYKLFKFLGSEEVIDRISYFLYTEDNEV